MKHTFRNDEQKEAFDDWWNGSMRQLFAKRADEVEANENAMWIVGIAYQAGLEKMCHTVQDALQLATTQKIS